MGPKRDLVEDHNDVLDSSYKEDDHICYSILDFPKIEL